MARRGSLAIEGHRPLKKAKNSGYNQEGLTRSVDDSRIELDASVVERSIRPIVLRFAPRRTHALELGSPGCRSTRGLKLPNREKRYCRRTDYSAPVTVLDPRDSRNRCTKAAILYPLGGAARGERPLVARGGRATEPSVRLMSHVTDTGWEGLLVPIFFRWNCYDEMVNGRVGAWWYLWL